MEHVRYTGRYGTFQSPILLLSSVASRVDVLACDLFCHLICRAGMIHLYIDKRQSGSPLYHMNTDLSNVFFNVKVVS